jgi:hypothetical protein
MNNTCDEEQHAGPAETDVLPNFQPLFQTPSPTQIPGPYNYPYTFIIPTSSSYASKSPAIPHVFMSPQSPQYYSPLYPSQLPGAASIETPMPTDAYSE